MMASMRAAAAVAFASVALASASAAPQGALEVIRALVKEGPVNAVPAEGRVKLSIPKNPPTLLLPGGRSSALVLTLPDYKTPYVLTISSAWRQQGDVATVFVPSGVLLDADLGPVGEFMEEHLTGRGDSFVAQLVIDDQARHARYLLLYTRGDLVGQPLKLLGQNAFDDAVAGLMQGGLFRIERSFEASVQVETKPRPLVVPVQEVPLPDAARTLAAQGTVVKVPARGRIQHTIPAGAPVFSTPEGPSRLVLVELPAPRSPYVLAIESHHQRSKGVFVPSGLYLDADFKPRGQFGERVQAGQNRVVTHLAIDEAAGDIRYLLLFTRGSQAGLDVMVRGSNDTASWVERSLEGRLELEVLPPAAGR